MAEPQVYVNELKGIPPRRCASLTGKTYSGVQFLRFCTRATSNSLCSLIAFVPKA